MKAVMLVGGFGTRLLPLTLRTKKELMPVANRPFLEHVLARLARHGVEEAILTTGYLAEAFEGFPDDCRHGVRLTIVREEEPLDTCGAVKNVEHLLDGTFLVCNGDIFTELDISKLVAFHHERDTLATITLTRVEDPSAYGIVPIDEDGRIQRFIEKPSPDEIVTHLVNAGTYVLEPEVLQYVPAGVPFSFERVTEGGLFPLLLREGEALYGYVSDDYWLDIGTPAKYLKANRDALSRAAGLEPPGERIGPGMWIEPGAVVGRGARLQAPCSIGASSRIEDDAVVGPFTCVGAACVIEGGARVESSVLHDGVVMGAKADVVDTILGVGARVGGATRLEDVVIGPGVEVGAANELRGGVRLWPGVQLPDGSVTY